MFCSNCGKQIDDSAKFCVSCGSAVGGVAPVQQPVINTPIAEPVVAPAPIEEVAPVSQPEVAPAPVEEAAPVSQPEVIQPVEPTYQAPVYQTPVQSAAKPEKAAKTKKSGKKLSKKKIIIGDKMPIVGIITRSSLSLENHNISISMYKSSNLMSKSIPSSF